MPQVKIMYVERGYSDYEDSYDIKESITDWEEITDEELKFLKQYKYSLIPGYEGYIPLIFVKDKEPVAFRLTELRELLEKEKAAQEEKKRVIEEEKKKKESADKEKKEKRERTMLKKLQEKYGDELVDTH